MPTTPTWLPTQTSANDGVGSAGSAKLVVVATSMVTAVPCLRATIVKVPAVAELPQLPEAMQARPALRLSSSEAIQLAVQQNLGIRLYREQYVAAQTQTH